MVPYVAPCVMIVITELNSILVSSNHILFSKFRSFLMYVFTNDNLSFHVALGVIFSISPSVHVDPGLVY